MPAVLVLMGTFSYNGNKIITTGGGGMIVTNDEALAKRAKHLTTQAKSDPFEYMHDAIGYNYRLVNVCSGNGRCTNGTVVRVYQTQNTRSLIFIKMHYRAWGDIKFQQVSADVKT